MCIFQHHGAYGYDIFIHMGMGQYLSRYIFRVMNIHFNPAMTWGSRHGTRVLTHPHILMFHDILPIESRKIGAWRSHHVLLQQGEQHPGLSFVLKHRDGVEMWKSHGESQRCWVIFVGYPLVMSNIAIENDHLQWIYPLIMVIFYSYVSLPEGKSHETLMKSPFCTCFTCFYIHAG